MAERTKPLEGTARPPAAAPARKRVRDEELVALLVKVMLEEGTVSSQHRLATLVNGELKRRGGRVTAERLRRLAVKSGLVGLSMRTRTDGQTPTLERCPVCDARLKRTASRTLTGGTTSIGYKCPRCPWWTGRDFRIPQHYTFFARVSRVGATPQLAFVADARQKDAGAPVGPRSRGARRLVE